MTRRNLLVLLCAALLGIVCYERATRNRYVGTLAEAMRIIDAAYVEEVDQRKLFEGAMRGMVGQLDTYSSYISPEEFSRLQESIEQNFGGIGILVDYDARQRVLTVMSPLVGTPAYKAGLKQGDIILRINDRDATSMKVDESLHAIRGPVGTQVKLTIRHLGEETPREHILERARIVTDSVYGDLRRDDGTWDFHLAENRRLGLIRIGTFGERTAEELRKALTSFREPDQEIAGLILDLRGNSGGLLTSAVAVCDAFLDDGLIVSTRGRGGSLKDQRFAEPGVELERNIPLVLLVDRLSASASEIVAACLQDRERGVVCGERSWGKGTVQNLIELEGRRSGLRITTATYWRPSGRNIHKMEGASETDDWGVAPDAGLEVSLTNEEMARMLRDRRQRDFASGGRKPVTESNPPEAPPTDPAPEMPPTPQFEPNPVSPSSPPAELPFDDPQLRKAIEYLQSRIKQPAKS